VEWVAGLFFLFVLGILAYTQVQLAAWQSTAAYLDDALAASNLASALVDVEEYGKTHKIRIADASAAYEIYVESVRDNLQLNEQWECVNKALIAGPVEIVDYIVYNVEEDKVEAIRVDREGRVKESWSGVRGRLKAPDETVVEHTGVYSEIRFAVEGFPGIRTFTDRGKLVDIVAEGESG
jgi:hypothetical protein